MQISTWLWNWLESRRQRHSPQTPFDHAARLTLRKLESRQVLSVSAVVNAGVLDVQVTGNDTATVHVDNSGHLLIDSTNDPGSNIDQDLTGITSVHIVGENGTDQTVVFDGANALSLSGDLTIDTSIEHVMFQSDVHADNSISVTADDIALSSGALSSQTVGGTITLDATVGGLTESVGATITTDNLLLLGTGTFTLGEANTVNTLAVNISGSLDFNNSVGFAIGSVNAVDGITADSAQLSTTTGTIGLDADVTTNGDQDYLADVELLTSVTLNSGSGDINFHQTLDGTFALSISGGNNVLFQDGVGSTDELDSISINVGGTVTVDSSMALGEDGTHAGTLTVFADKFVLNGSINTQNAIAGQGEISILANTEIDLGGTISTTDGNVGFNGPVLLTNDVTITTQTGSVNFYYSVQGTTAGGQSLSITSNDSGSITFDGGVGDVMALNALSLNTASGVVDLENAVVTNDDVTLSGLVVFINGTITTQGAVAGVGDVTITSTFLTALTQNITTTSGNITLDGFTRLDSSITLSADSGDVTINGFLDSNDLGGAPVDGLTIVSNSGTVLIQGQLGTGAVPGSDTDGVAFLDVTGSTQIGADIITSGTQTYHGPVELLINSNLTSTANDSITFDDTVDGAFDLTVTTGGTTTFSGNVGTNSTLTSLVTNSGGTTVLNTATIQAGTVNFGDSVALAQDVAINAAQITFAGTLDEALVSTGSDLTLTITNPNDPAGDITFTGAVGSGLALDSITVNNANDVTFQSTVATDGSITQLAGTGTTSFGGVASLGNLLTITTDNITVDANITTVGAVSLNADDVITFNAGLDAGASTIAINANTAGADASGFVQTAGIIQTTNNTANAIAVSVGGTGDAAVRDLRADTTSGTVTISASGGAIIDNLAGEGTNVTAANLAVTAATGIGSGDNINTAISAIEAQTTNGGIFVSNSGNLTIGDVTASLSGVDVIASGNVSIITVGALTVHEGVSGPDNITMTATGATSDLTISSGSGVSSTGGDIALNSDRTVTISEDVSTIAAGTISVSGNGGDGATNIIVNTNAIVSVVDGQLTLDADQGAGVAGNFTGIVIDNATLQTSTGDIVLMGRGGDDVGTGNHAGIRVTNGTVVSSSGSGSILLTGIGGVGTSQNSGIVIDGGQLQSNSTAVHAGSIQLTGMGGTGSVGGNTGVTVSANGTVTTQVGDIVINGQGGAGGADNIGVLIGATGLIQSSDAGTIEIVGTGGSGTGTNDGVRIDNGGAVKSTSNSIATTGDIQITGTEGTGTGGVGINLAGAISSVNNSSVGTANIKLIADRIKIDTTTGTISAGAKTVTLRQLTNGTAIDLGSVNDNAANTLELSAAELNRINAGLLVIGDANAGSITISDGIAPTQVSTMHLITGSAVLDGNNVGNDITIANLAIDSATGIASGTTLETAVGNLAFHNTTSGNVAIANTGGLTINSVAGILTSSNDAATGTITLSAASPITYAVNMTSGGTITASTADNGGANVDNITVNAGVTVESTSGDVVFEAGDRIIINNTGTVKADVGNVSLTSGFGDTDNDGAQTLNGTIQAGQTVTINLSDESGSASEGVSGTILAVNLQLLSAVAGGSFVLTSATNNVDVIAANVDGALQYQDVNGVDVGTVSTSGITTTGDNVTIKAGGAVGINQSISAGAGTVRIAAAGNVTEAGGKTISAQTLGVTTSAGDITLDQSNSVATFAANDSAASGKVTFVNSGNLSIGSVGVDAGLFAQTDGITTNAGDVTIAANGSVTLDESIAAAGATVRIAAAGDVTEASGKTISASQLGVQTSSGDIVLTEANTVGTFAASNSAAGNVIKFRDSTGFNIGAVSNDGTLFLTTSGIGTSNGDVTLKAGGTIGVNESVIAGNGTVRITAAGDVTEGIGKTITADRLGVTTTAGNILLTQSNQVNFFSADNSGLGGDVKLQTAGAVTVDAVTADSDASLFAGTSGVLTNDGDFTLAAAGTILINQAVNVGAGTVRLQTSTGGVSQSASGTITADKLGVRNASTGNITLDQNNDVGTFAATNTAANGTVTYHDANAVTIGTVSADVPLFTATNGISTNASDVSVSTGGLLMIGDGTGQDILASGAIVTLSTTAGGVAESAGSIISADKLLLLGTGAYTLTEANTVGTLAADVDGTIDYVDADALHVGTVGLTDGIKTTNDSVSVTTTTGNLTLDQAINAGTGTVTLEATAASIVDGNDGSTMITAGDLSLTAKTNIGDITNWATGTGDAIDATITGSLTKASVTDAGGEIFVHFTGNATIGAGALDLAPGVAASAIITATGDLDAQNIDSGTALSNGDQLALEADGTLTLPDAGLDVGDSGNLRLRGSDDVVDASGRTLGELRAADLNFTSGSTGGDTVLNTRVGTITASLTGANASGQALTINEYDGLTLTGVSTTDGDLTVNASQTVGGNITVIDVNAGTARATLNTTSNGGGQIIDGDGIDSPTTADIAANEVDLRATGGIANGTALEVAANFFAATTATGDINIRDVSGDLTVANLAGGTNGVSITAGTSGNKIAVSTVGGLTVNADVTNIGTGNRSVLLAADGTGSNNDLSINADVTTAGGDSGITLLAGDTVSIASASTVGASGSGLIDVLAGTAFNNGAGISTGTATGNIMMADGAVVESDDGNITLSAPNDVQLSIVNANANNDGVRGNLSITANADNSSAGAITEVLTGEGANLIGQTATLSAATGIGNADDIDTNLVNVSAVNTTSGAIRIQEVAAGGDLILTGASNSGSAIDVATIDGQLTVSGAVSTTGSGTIDLFAGDSAANNGGNLVLQNTINAQGGQITLTSERNDVTFTAAADVTSTTGTIQVNAGTATGGQIVMTDDNTNVTVINAGSGLIDLNAGGDVVLGKLVTTSASTTAVQIHSTAGAVIDADTNGAVDVAAANGRLVIVAATGVGSSNAIETTVASLDITNSTTGNVKVDETSALSIENINQQAAGTVDVTTAGAMTVAGTGISATTGKVTLIANGGSSTVDINAGITTTGGDVDVIAGSTLTVNQSINTGGGAGGLITVTNAVLNAPLVAGAGDITLNGGGQDLIINVDQTSNTTITYQADRDIIIRATITANGAGSSIIATADFDNDGVGGVWLDEAGSLTADAKLVAGDAVTLTGSDLFAAAGDPRTTADAVRVSGDGANLQIQAGSSIQLLAKSNTPTGSDVVADIVLDGKTDAGTTLTVTADAGRTIYLSADQSAAAGMTFSNHVVLTENVALTTGVGTGDVTFAGAVDAEGPLTGETLTITASGGSIFFNSTVGATNRLGAITITSADDVHFSNTVTAASLTQQAGTGTTTLDGTVDTNTATGVQLTGTNLSVNASITTTGSGVVTFNEAGTAAIASAGDIDADGAVTITAVGGISTAGDITTSNDDVTFASSTTLTGPVAIDTGAGVGNIAFQAALNGTQTLNLTAGTGDISFTGAVGAINPLQSITVNTAHDVTFNSPVATVGNLTQLAGTGTTTFNGTSGTGIGGALSVTTTAVTLNSATVTTVGAVSLNAADAIVFNAGLNAGASTIAINANTSGTNAAGFTQTAGMIQTTNTSTSAVSITINNASGGTGSAAVRDIQTGSGGTLTITTAGGGSITGGSITQAAGTLNVGNGTINLTTPTGGASGIGTSANPIMTNALNVIAAAGSGGVFITEVGTGGGVNFTASATGAGNIELRTAAGSGNDLTIAGVVTTGSGNILISSDDAVNVNANVGGPTFSGTVTILANQDGTGSDSFTQNTAAVIQTTNNTATAVAITVGGTGNAAISDVRANTTNGIVTVTAAGGTITDNLVGEAANVTAAGLAMTASNGIGVSGVGNINTAVTNLEATTTTGGVFVANSGNLTIGGVNGTLSGVDVTGASGEIEIQGTGSITVSEGISAPADVTLSAGGAIQLNQSIAATGAAVRLQAVGGITQAAAGTITANSLGARNSGSGTITLDQGNDVNVFAAQNTAVNGSVSFQDVNTLTLGTVSADGALFATTAGVATNTGDATLTTGNTLTIGNGASESITATGATVTLNTAAGGVGEAAGSTVSSNKLLLSGIGIYSLLEANQVGTLAASVLGSIDYHDADALTVGTVGLTNGITTGNGVTPGGDVTISSGGVLTVDQVINTTIGSGGLVTVSNAVLNAALVAGAGNITLNGGGQDLIVTADQSSNTTITYSASRDIIIQATVTASGAASDIRLTADSDGDHVGGVWIDESAVTDAKLDAGHDVVLKGSDVFATGASSDSIRIDSDGAAVQVIAGHDISLIANAAAPAGADIVINGVETASTGSLTVDSADAILLAANQNAGTDIHFLDAVQLTGNLTLTAGQNVTFDKTLDGAQSLQITAAGVTAFEGAIGGNAALVSLTTDAAGTTDLNGGTVNVTTADFKDDVILTADTTVTGTTATFEKTINADLTANNRTLLVNGTTTTFGGVIGNTGVLHSLTTNAAGTTNLNGGTINATTVTFHDSVVLGVTNTITATTVSFDGTVDGTTAGVQGLTVNASGVTTFGDGVGDDLVGGLVSLSFLTTDAAGSTVLKSTNITTSGDQTYHDAVTLESNNQTPNTTLNGTNVSFDSTLDGTVAATQGLTINASGTTTFGDGLGDDRVGTTSLAFLTTDAAGSTVVKSTSVTTSGSQTYHDAVVLASNDQTPNTTLKGTNVSFDSTLDGTVAATQGLTINASGITTFGDGLGDDRVGTTSLSFLTTDAPGSTVLKSTSVTTSGDQTYRDAVTLASNNQTPDTTLNGSNVSFDSTLDGTVAATQGLTINASGVTTFGDGLGDDRVGTTSLAFLTTDTPGSTVLKSTSVTTSGNQTYHDAVVLASNNQTPNTTLNGTNISFDSTVDGTVAATQGLTINASGVTAFGDGLGDDRVGTTSLAFLTTDAAGSTILKTTSVTTSGNQTYHDAVVLASNDQTSNTTLNGTNVSFDSTVDGTVAGTQGLTVNASGVTTFGDGLGDDRVGTTSLSFLTTDAPGSTVLKTTSVTTSGDQTYHDAFVLASNNQTVNTTLNGTNVSFDSTVDGTVAATQGLTINASGVTTFGDGLGDDRVGTTSLAFLTTDAPGATVLKTTSVTTSGDQTYHDAVTLASNNQTPNTTLNGTNISFDSTVDGTVAATQGLTINASGVTTFGDGLGNDLVGSGASLAFVTTDAVGSTVLKTTSVTTSGNQTYHDAVVLASNDQTSNTTLNGTNISFDRTVDATAAGIQGLTVNASGITTFGDGIGNDNVGGIALAFLTTDAPGSTVLMSTSVTTTGDQTYHDAVVLASNNQTPNTTLNGSNVSFDSTLDGTVAATQGLTINASGVTTFGDGLGDDRVGTTSLAFLTTDTPGSTVLKSTSVTTSGNQTYHDAVVLASNNQTPNTTLNGTNISFDSTVDGTVAATQGLTINASGVTTFGDGLGDDRVGTTSLAFLTTDAAGSTILKTTSVTTSGNQTYHDAVVLASNDQTSNTTLNGTNVSFDSTVDGTVIATQGLTINASGMTTFGDGIGDDRVGGSVSLSFLTTDAAGSTVLKATSVTTGGDQTYRDVVTLASNDQTANTTLNGTNISFDSTIDGTSAATQGLTVNSSGVTTFGDGFGDDRVGGTVSLAFLTTDTSGSTVLKTTSVTTSGNQTYHDAVVLASNDQTPNTTLNGTNVSFDSTLDGTVAATQGLTINASGTTTFGDGVGDDRVGTTSLAFLTTDAPGSTVLKSTSVTTSGDQTYHDAVTLASNNQTANTTLNGTNISFDSTVDGTLAGTQGLTVNASGITTFGNGLGDDRVGGATSLAFLTTNAAGSTVLKSTSVTTAGDQTYLDQVFLDSNDQTAITTLNANNLTFGSTLDGTSIGVQGLTVNAAADVLFTGAVGGAVRLGDVVIVTADDVTESSGVSATSFVQQAGTGTTTFNGAVNTNSATGVQITTNQITINALITTTGGGVVTFTNAGLLTINGNITSDGAITQNGAGVVTITEPRTLTTTGDAVSFATDVTLNGSGSLLTIDTTLGGNPNGANVSFLGFVHGATAGVNAEDLAINAGTAGQINFVGAVDSLGTITIVNSVNTTFQSTLSADTVLITDTTGTVAFQGNTNLSTLTTTAQPYSVTFGKVGGPAVTDVITNPVNFLNTGLVTVGLNAGDSVTFSAGVTHTAGNTSTTGTVTTLTGGVTFAATTLDGTIQTQGQQVSVQALTLAGSSLINTAFGNAIGANVLFNNTVDATNAGIQDLTVNAGTGGDVLFTGAVGAGTRLGDLVITNAHNVTEQAGITATSFGQTAGTGTTTLNGAVNTNAVTGVNLVTNEITINNTITTTGAGTVTFTNAGLLTINADINSDGAVTQNGVGVVTITEPIGGTRSITTTGDAVSFLRAVTLIGSGGQLSIDTTTSGNTAGAAVTFSSTLNATTAAPNAERLLINAGTGGDILLSGAVGNLVRLGDITIASAHNVTESAGIRAASLTQTTGTGLTKFDGAVDTDTATGISVTTGAIAVNNTATATNQIVLKTLNVNGNIDLNSTLQTTQPTGTVSLIAVNGGITNGAPVNVINVITNSLVMQTTQGIGSTDNALQTDVNTIAAHNTGSGNIRIDNVNTPLLTISTVGGVSGITNDGTSTGSITITNTGSILVSPISSPTNGAITNSTGGDITLLTKGGSFDITVNSPIVASGGSGNISLGAGHDVTINDTGVTNDISATGNGTVSLNAAHNLTIGSQNPNTTPDATQHTVANDVVIQTGTGSVTNTLPLIYNVQSPQITAEGEVVLSGDFGRPGEHDFTITVYWGDGTSTTQTFADPGHFSFSHTYHGNPNKDDQSAPILINVQVAHDSHIVLTALNVNTTTESVPDAGVLNPPPVPVPNINADLSSAIYNSQDPNYDSLHGANTKIVSAPGNQTNPGTVVFQDISILATAVPVPGEGLATFPYDVTPPVVYLHFPEQAPVIDYIGVTPLQLAQSDNLRLELAGGEEAMAGERQVFLEILRADGSIEKIRLPESVLDDLLKTISNLPDGRYRFQLLEPGESRLRLLLDSFDVRQGKIVDEHDDSDRPPSGAKTEKMADDEPADAEEAIRNAHQTTMMIAPLFGDSMVENSTQEQTVVRSQEESTVLWNGWSSMAARQAWRRAEQLTDQLVEQSSDSDDLPKEAADPIQAEEASRGDTFVAAGAVMLVGATLAGTANRSSRNTVPTESARFGRAARLFRKFGTRPK